MEIQIHNKPMLHRAHTYLTTTLTVSRIVAMSPILTIRFKKENKANRLGIFR